MTRRKGRDPRSMHRFHQSTHLETKPFPSFVVFQTCLFFVRVFWFISSGSFHHFISLRSFPPLPNDCLWVYFGYQKQKTLSCERGNSILRTESKQGKSASPQSISCSETNGNFVWVSRNANPIPYTQGVGIISGVMLPSCDAFRVIDLAL